MIIRKRTLKLPGTYPLERIGKLDKLLFFDIETTGFSGNYSALYLIGCTYYQDGAWQLIQWFADTPRAEPELLKHFFTFMQGYRVLVHFNGDGFDIPYLQKRCAKWKLPYGFSDIRSFDIYKMVKPLRGLLGLNSLKQKSIEQFLGLHRQDKYSGGQLIDVYQEYLHTHADLLYDMLILHNAEDLEGMPLLLPILNYPDFFRQPLQFECLRAEDAQGLLAEDAHPRPEGIRLLPNGTRLFPESTHLHPESAHRQPEDAHLRPTGGYLELRLTSEICLPRPIKLERDPISAVASGNALAIQAKLYQGTLKHFYPNYKDYYYLIYEDTAVHKSVGEYVDKGARIRATAKTCYTKTTGIFLPQFAPLWEPELKKEPKDKISYAQYSPACLEDEHCRTEYVKQLLGWLGLAGYNSIYPNTNTK